MNIPGSPPRILTTRTPSAGPNTSWSGMRGRFPPSSSAPAPPAPFWSEWEWRWWTKGIRSWSGWLVWCRLQSIKSRWVFFFFFFCHCIYSLSSDRGSGRRPFHDQICNLGDAGCVCLYKRREMADFLSHFLGGRGWRMWSNHASTDRSFRVEENAV